MKRAQGWGVGGSEIISKPDFAAGARSRLPNPYGFGGCLFAYAPPGAALVVKWLREHRYSHETRFPAVAGAGRAGALAGLMSQASQTIYTARRLSVSHPACLCRWIAASLLRL